MLVLCLSEAETRWHEGFFVAFASCCPVSGREKYLNAVGECIDGRAVNAGGKDGFFSSCA